MMKLIATILLGLLIAGPALAADNVTVKDAGGSNVVLRCRDVGSGVQSCQNVLGDANGNTCEAGSGGTPGCYVGIILSVGNGALSDHYVNIGSGDQHNVGSNAAKLLVGAHLSNVASTMAWVKFYNKQSCANTDTPLLAVMVPGNTSGAGREVMLPPMGKAFGTALCIRIVANIADNDATAITPATIIVDLDYY